MIDGTYQPRPGHRSATSPSTRVQGPCLIRTRPTLQGAICPSLHSPLSPWCPFMLGMGAVAQQGRGVVKRTVRHMLHPPVKRTEAGMWGRTSQAPPSCLGELTLSKHLLCAQLDA